MRIKNMRIEKRNISLLLLISLLVTNCPLSVFGAMGSSRNISGSIAEEADRLESEKGYYTAYQAGTADGKDVGTADGEDATAASPITIDVSKLKVGEGIKDSGTGWSFDGQIKLTLQSGYEFIIQGDCDLYVQNDGTIVGGTFTKQIFNRGTINNGIFRCYFSNWGKINGGTFYAYNEFSELANNKSGTISGGIFYTKVTNFQSTISGGTFNVRVYNFNGTISGGTFNETVTNYDTITGGTFASIAGTGKISLSSGENFSVGDSSQFTGTVSVDSGEHTHSHTQERYEPSETEEKHYHLDICDGCPINHVIRSEEDCTPGNPATCITAQTCTLCSRDLMAADKSAHIYNVKTVSAQTLKAEADCTKAAEYYYSCICGEVSPTETFMSGEALGHGWSLWAHVGGNQYQRSCEREHTQTVTLFLEKKLTLSVTPELGKAFDAEPPTIYLEGEKEEFPLEKVWEIRPLGGDWEKVSLPLTLEERHMGGSLRYTLKGEWGSLHSEERVLTPQGIWISGLGTLSYTGEKVIHDLRLYDGDTLLEEKVDYTLTYKNNLKAYEPENRQKEAASIALESKAAAPLGVIQEGNGVSVVDVSLYDKKKAPQAVVKMKGNYKGTYTIYFTIKKQDIEEAQAENLTLTYTGKDQRPVPAVTLGGTKLVNNRDYVIEEYQDKTGYTEAGEHTLTLVGKGNFTGRKTISLTITANEREIAMDRVKVSGVKALAWRAEGATHSSLVVKYKNKVLSGRTESQPGEFTVSYADNDKAGKATLILTGTGEDVDGDGFAFKGTKKVTFTITGVSMSKVQVTGLEKVYTYTGEEICPTQWRVSPEGEERTVRLKVVDPMTGEVRILTEGEDYTVNYQSNVKKGKAVVLFTGRPEAGYTGVKKCTFTIQAESIAKETGEGEEEAFAIRITDKDCIVQEEGKELLYQMPYTQGGVRPAVTVTHKGRILKEGTDYTISYRNNKAVANTADPSKAPTVIVRGKGNYQGQRSLSFAIVPKDVTEGSPYAGQVAIVALDKEESRKRNGWKQSFKVLDQNGKAVSKRDYQAAGVMYTLEELPQEAGEELWKIKAEGSNLAEAGDLQLPAGTTVRIELKLQGNYQGGVSTTYRILEKGRDIRKAVIQLKPQEYTGEEIHIDSNEDFVKSYLKSGQEILPLYLNQEGETKPNLQVISYENNLQKGRAKVTFRGIGEYGGEKMVSFTIKQRSLTSVWEGIFNGVMELVNRN